jgi:hypothetical protein
MITFERTMLIVLALGIWFSAVRPAPVVEIDFPTYRCTGSRTGFMCSPASSSAENSQYGGNVVATTGIVGGFNQPRAGRTQ